jgi:hypothetical protein
MLIFRIYGVSEITSYLSYVEISRECDLFQKLNSNKETWLLGRSECLSCSPQICSELGKEVGRLKILSVNYGKRLKVNRNQPNMIYL